MSHLTLPCHWSKEVIENILTNSDNRDMDIVEIYGALAGDIPIGHGRSSKSVTPISKEESIEFRKFIRSKGINFTYLINAPFSFHNESQKILVREYLEWILGEFKPDALTISSRELMQFVREMDRRIPIHISTIAGIKTAAELESYLDIRPSRIVPHHDCGKRFGDLAKLVEVGNDHGVDIELLSTESCLFECPHRDAHYECLSKKDKDAGFHTSCNTAKLNSPREFLRAGGVIRPEDTAFYEQLGIKYFKISGRSKSEAWLPEVVKAYLNRSYDGNLMRLLGIDPSLKAENWIYINNKSLDGFIENYPRNRNGSDEIAYCDRWTSKLYKEGEFRLLDGTNFTINGDTLELKDLGQNAEQIISF